MYYSISTYVINLHFIIRTVEPKVCGQLIITAGCDCRVPLSETVARLLGVLDPPLVCGFVLDLKWKEFSLSDFYDPLKTAPGTRHRRCILKNNFFF